MRKRNCVITSAARNAASFIYQKRKNHVNRKDQVFQGHEPHTKDCPRILQTVLNWTDFTTSTQATQRQLYMEERENSPQRLKGGGGEQSAVIRYKL